MTVKLRDNLKESFWRGVGSSWLLSWGVWIELCCVEHESEVEPQNLARVREARRSDNFDINNTSKSLFRIYQVIETSVIVNNSFLDEHSNCLSKSWLSYF